MTIIIIYVLIHIDIIKLFFLLVTYFYVFYKYITFLYVSNIFNFSGSELYLFHIPVFVANIILYLNIVYLYGWISICTNIFKHSRK